MTFDATTVLCLAGIWFGGFLCGRGLSALVLFLWGRRLDRQYDEVSAEIARANALIRERHEHGCRRTGLVYKPAADGMPAHWARPDGPVAS